MSASDIQGGCAEPHPAMTLMRLFSQHWKLEAIYAAARLHIAEALADGSRTVAELAEITDTHPPSLHRLMRALTCIGLFAELDGSRFANTELSQLLRPEVAGSFYGMTQMDRDFMLRPWAELPYSVRTGEAGFDKAYGMPMWRYFTERDPAAGAYFNARMTSFSAVVDSLIAQAAGLSGTSTVVDVGGGRGDFLTTLLTTYPSIEKGTLFDQPHVIAEVRTALDPAVDGRLRLVGGDFFTAVPTEADVYVMKGVLHNWNDAACLDILTNCRRAMPPHGRLLAAELVLDADRNDELTYSLDLQMLVLFGSKERTAEEFQALYDTAGLRLTRIIPTTSMFSLVEGVPAMA